MLKECPDAFLMRSFWIFEAYSLGLTCSVILATVDIHGYAPIKGPEDTNHGAEG